MNRWYIIMSLLVFMLPATSCFVINTPPPPTGKLEILNHSLTREDSGAVKVEVTVKNAGPSTIELAKVTVSFQDAQENLIDSSSDAVMNLKPGENWIFEFTCPGTDCDQVMNYKIETMAGTSSGGR